MASLARGDDTLLVRKIPPPRQLTMRFGPEPRVRWPWIIAGLLWIAGLVEPLDADRELRLSTQAHELRRVLPG